MEGLGGHIQGGCGLLLMRSAKFHSATRNLAQLAVMRSERRKLNVNAHASWAVDLFMVTLGGWECHSIVTNVNSL